jgi:DNA-binding GntR family transcriptional regulator
MSRTLDDVLSAEDLAVQRVSTVDHVADRLKAMIADGRLPQGERLREMPLAEAFSVSRTTIRDAIRELAAEGLVTHEFHKGAMVALLSQADIAEVYRIRRLLELPALAEAQHGPDEATKRAQQALATCAEAADDDYSTFVEAEIAFHAAIVGYLGSPRIDQFFARVLSTLRLALSLLGEDRRPTTTHNLTRRYNEIFDAARRGEVAAAQRQLSAHLDAYEARLLRSADLKMEKAGSD